MNSKDIAVVASAVIFSAGAVYLGVRIYDDHFSAKAKELDRYLERQNKKQEYDIVIDLNELDSLEETTNKSDQSDSTSPIIVRPHKETFSDKFRKKISETLSETIKKVPIKAEVKVNMQEVE